ncbi:hypothetical protein CF15_03330 [Pyrodictium occultum]|uniref:Uncharacterized protein n=1 Tax=Pyrodictium occultum TaxID=2309 RepID=A0A0V8RUU9_PYROC|nr:hypothetical protein [Pyrodictium occultum]KSW11847.1 hypothetical protein CF15_03330 [Pyrodictium occultum]
MHVDVNASMLLAALALTLLVNVPFGYWRAFAKRSRRMLEWAIAVHAPVPVVVVLRHWAGVQLSLDYAGVIALFVAMYFAGQRVGAMIHGILASRGCMTGRNMFDDVLRFYRAASRRLQGAG